MNRVPLAEFQRNALRTSLKDRTPADLNDYSAAKLRELVTECFQEERHYLEDAWEAADIATASTFIAHTDFRGYPIEKDRNFAEALADWRQPIVAGEFPCAAEIQAGITADYPPLIACEREAGRFYVLDGQRRIITLLYHRRPLAKAHIYRGSRGV